MPLKHPKRRAKLTKQPYEWSKEKLKHGTFLYAVFRMAGLSVRAAAFSAAIIQVGGVILLLYGTFLMIEFRGRFNELGCAAYCSCVPSDTYGLGFHFLNDTTIYEVQNAHEQPNIKEPVEGVRLVT